MAGTGVKAFVFSSTCATYGDPVETPMTETHPQRPINAYGETKLAIEQALPHFERAYGLKWVALRYFNAAGADPDGLLGEDHHPEIHIIPRAIDAALGRDSLQVFGDDYPTPDGTCLRDYIHVTDLADAHVRALDSLAGGGASEAFNVGTGQPTFGARGDRGRRTRGRAAGVVHGRAAPARRSAGPLRRQRRASRERLGLDAALRGHRRHRRHRLALARGAPHGYGSVPLTPGAPPRRTCIRSCGCSATPRPTGAASASPSWRWWPTGSRRRRSRT